VIATSSAMKLTDYVVTEAASARTSAPKFHRYQVPQVGLAALRSR